MSQVAILIGPTCYNVKILGKSESIHLLPEKLMKIPLLFLRSSKPHEGNMMNVVKRYPREQATQCQLGQEGSCGEVAEGFQEWKTVMICGCVPGHTVRYLES